MKKKKKKKKKTTIIINMIYKLQNTGVSCN